MTCRHCSKPHSTPTDILTYRYNGKMIYVPAAPDYNVSHSSPMASLSETANKPNAVGDLACTLTCTRCIPATQGHARRVPLALTLRAPQICWYQRTGVA